MRLRLRFYFLAFTLVEKFELHYTSFSSPVTAPTPLTAPSSPVDSSVVVALLEPSVPSPNPLGALQRYRRLIKSLQLDSVALLFAKFKLN